MGAINGIFMGVYAVVKVATLPIFEWPHDKTIKVA